MVFLLLAEFCVTLLVFWNVFDVYWFVLFFNLDKFLFQPDFLNILILLLLEFELFIKWLGIHNFLDLRRYKFSIFFPSFFVVFQLFLQCFLSSLYVYLFVIFCFLILFFLGLFFLLKSFSYFARILLLFTFYCLFMLFYFHHELICKFLFLLNLSFRWMLLCHFSECLISWLFWD